jgi:fucose 4-O-acetylase-like acetyltransferase
MHLWRCTTTTRGGCCGGWRTNAALTVVGGLMIATLAATLVGLAVDPRVITGAPAWLKPTRFAISTAIYAFTLVWLLSFVRGHARLVAIVGNTTAIALTIEVAIICAQVVRGTTSHFNNATPLDATLFQIMGGFIVLVWLMGLLTAGLPCGRRRRRYLRSAADSGSATTSFTMAEESR